MGDKDWYLKDFKSAFLSKTRVLGPVEQMLIRDSAARAGMRDTKFLHPSQICKKDWCPRSSWYTIIDGKSPDQPANLQRLNIFAEGNRIHSKWQSWLLQAGLLEGKWYCPECESNGYDHLTDDLCPMCERGHVSYREVSISNEEYHLLGHADGIINDPQGRAVLEIKSVGVGTVRFDQPDLFMRYSKGELTLDGMWKEIKTPFISHLRQVNLYMYCLNIHQGVVLYEWKPTQDLKEFSVKYQPELIEHILAGCSTVKSALDKGTTPMRPLNASLDSQMCKTCPYYKRCWSIDEDQQDNTVSERPIRVEVRKASTTNRGSSQSSRIIRRSV